MEKEYKVEFVDDKSPEWKIATLSDDEGMHQEVSINLKNKQGEVFPDFDKIVEGSTVKGNLWKSSMGRLYLFAPSSKPQRSAGAVAKAMERKEQSISKFQDSKEQGIKISSTIRMAVDCAIAEYEKGDINTKLDDLIRKWRRTLWFEWENHSEYPPFE